MGLALILIIIICILFTIIGYLSYDTSMGRRLRGLIDDELILSSDSSDNVWDKNENVLDNKNERVYGNNLDTVSTLETIDSLNSDIPNKPNIPRNIDGDLLRAFIGKNFEKITSRKFNFSAFFFNVFYLFYRKMFAYGIIYFLLNFVVLNYISSEYGGFILSLILGFVFNPLYLNFAKKKVATVKGANAGKTDGELIGICASKGGTSIPQIFLGILAELGVGILLITLSILLGIGGFIVDLVNPSNWSSADISKDYSSYKKISLSDVSVGSYSCFGSKCTVMLTDASGNSGEYMTGNNIISNLSSYNDYVKLDIVYAADGDNKVITDYKIYRKLDNKNISYVKKENELRDLLGFPSLGEHTDSLTLTEVGTTGFGSDDSGSFTYTTYVFTNDSNIKMEMQYKNGTLNANVGGKYNVTYEVSEGFYKYDYTIMSIN